MKARSISFSRRTALTCAAVVLFSSPLAAFAKSPIVIKFSHVVAGNTSTEGTAEFFAKRAGELTSGKAKAEIYPHGQLYKDKEETQAQQLAIWDGSPW